MTAQSQDGLILHASCVALDEATGLLILGPSGSGKSTLALELMALGAVLVSDDRTHVRCDPKAQTLTAIAPDTISGMIEARGVGLLRAEPLPAAILRGVVDLSQVETDRLPLRREKALINVSIPLFYRVDGPQFAPALIQWLKGGRCA
ncbi:HPr kinase/phosphorylase [Celeribacter halophilus]|uniref:Hpr(Ser) kinase/phosphatase n=1 Tax=Celeribacter halophilus TaxID=576117 RepID=A0A1I3SQ40_9RHOB|nr:HPr kinase/phosphatase C-terminal domain-containing protein [Celeribacter halophilus]PZX12141.1 Hpr(Ser) kinase/phosphatase [Celeribacter halophilus]SFJ60914.1 Hpr(Ser) kinase/phosphatase [Celeribacter halophilus]